MKFWIVFTVMLLIMLSGRGSMAYESAVYEERFQDALENAFKESNLIASIVIENQTNGEIYLVSEENQKRLIGHVIVPAVKWSEKPFEATGWAPEGVCAVAVNAIHIKKNVPVGQSPLNYRLISILPSEMIEVDPKSYPSYYQTSSSIYTDIKAGTNIFGGLITPFLGAKVEYSEGEIPERITIDYSIPNPMPLWITFENRFGGMIKIKYAGQDELPVGLVYRPVYGVGRFTGTLYCDIGRIRAVHTGVIDVSTSPIGEIGGFQIVPHFHADTSGVRNIRLLTQWMVIGPLDPTQNDYGYLPELFRLLQPRYIVLNESTVDSTYPTIMSRIHVVAKFRGDNEWRNFPPLIERIDDALESLEEIRIYFPREETYNLK